MKNSSVYLCVLLLCSLLSAETVERVAVAPFFVKGISEAKSDTLRGAFIAKYNESAKFKAVEQEKMDFILDETEFHKSNIVSELSYALALGRLLSVQYIIVSSFEKTKKESVCTFKVIDAETQKYILNFTETAPDANGKLWTKIAAKIIKTVDPLIAAIEKKQIPLEPAITGVNENDTSELVKDEPPVDLTEKQSPAVDTAAGNANDNQVSVSKVSTGEKTGEKTTVAEKKSGKEKRKAKKTTVVEKKPEKVKKTVKKEPEKSVAQKSSGGKEMNTQSKAKPESDTKKSKKKGGVIVAVTTGVGLAVAIPAILYLRSQGSDEGTEQGTFFLTIEW